MLYIIVQICHFRILSLATLSAAMTSIHVRVTAGLRSGDQEGEILTVVQVCRYISQVSLVVLKTNFNYIINNARLEKLNEISKEIFVCRVEGLKTDFFAQLWDFLSGEEELTLQHNNIVKNVNISDNSFTLATGRIALKVIFLHINITANCHVIRFCVL